MEEKNGRAGALVFYTKGKIREAKRVTFLYCCSRERHFLLIVPFFVSMQLETVLSSSSVKLAIDRRVDSS